MTISINKWQVVGRYKYFTISMFVYNVVLSVQYLCYLILLLFYIFIVYTNGTESPVRSSIRRTEVLFTCTLN